MARKLTKRQVDRFVPKVVARVMSVVEDIRPGKWGEEPLEDNLYDAVRDEVEKLIVTEDSLKAGSHR